MAANKFATMVHRNTNKMTLILVYAALEWTLIALLLFNSLFSYLIVKFADYFGLERPCLWCSRLDHVFEPRRSHRDLVCEAHAREISGLEYCPSHRRLAESRDLCEDCSASETDAEWSKRFGFFPWTTKQIGTIGEFVGLESELDEEEEEEENSKCSCCGASLSGKRFFDPCILIKPSSWGGVLDFPQKENLDVDDDLTFEADNSDHSRSEEEDGIEDVRQEATAIEEESCAEQSKVTEAPVRHLEFYIGHEDCTLIPIVEEGESETMASLPLEPVLVSQVAQTVFEEDSKSNLHQGSEVEDEETDGEISIGTEIPDHEPMDEIEQVVETRSYQVNDSIDFHVDGNHVEPLLVLQGTILDTPGWSAEELRAALKAVYAELEEERSAAAVAASQTMAMINRLQEEKAAVQMEAVHYRRMMEEQSEYDQEALHDLRADLDACRSLLRDYQARDRIAAATASSSDDDVYDGGEEEEEERIAYTPAEAVLYFEEERISILDQLRALEEKLFTLSDDDDDGETGHSNGYCHHHHDHNHHRGAVKAKRLLPLFEAAGDGDGECEGKRRGAVVVEEEVERVYDRLHALEADREFLRRCVGSLRKGNKGLLLLGEILRHLRHLRTVEHRAAAVDGDLA